MDQNPDHQSKIAEVIYIYGLRCPLTKQIRYIGKTNKPDNRLYRHLSMARYYQHNTARWIKKLKRSGLRPTIEVLFTVPVGESWQEHEKRCISEALAAGLHLTNQSAGGEGVVFITDGDLVRAKAARKAGFTPEVRRRMSRSIKAAWADPEKRARIIEKQKTAANLPDRRIQLKAAARAKTTEGKLRQIAGVKAGAARRRACKPTRSVQLMLPYHPTKKS